MKIVKLKQFFTAVLISLLAYFIVGYFLLNNAMAEPFKDIIPGTCSLDYKAYELIPGGYVVSGRESINKNIDFYFPGYSIWQYLYPSCPAKGEKGYHGKEYFSFRDNGSFEINGNLAISGDKTYFLKKPQSDLRSEGMNYATVARFTELPNGERNLEKNYLGFEFGFGNLDLYGDALLGKTWKDEGRGPSVYFNSKTSKLEFSAGMRYGDPLRNSMAYIGNSRNNRIFEVINLGKDNEGLGEPYPGYTGGCNFEDPRGLDYKDGFYYVTDQGSRKIFKCNKNNENEYASLGGRDWNWELGGIAVDEDNTIFVTDSAKDQIIRVKLGEINWAAHTANSAIGEWHESKSEYLDSYKVKLFLTGEENVRATGINGHTATRAYFKDSSIAKYKVGIAGTSNLTYDPVTQKVNIQDESKKLFDKYSYNFDGQTSLIIQNSDGLDPGNQDFIVDFWVNFNSISGRQEFFSKDKELSFYWDGDEKSFVFFANFEEEGEKIARSQNYAFNIGEWHHIALVRKQNVVKFFVDGESIGQASNMAGSIIDEDKFLYIGSSPNFTTNAVNARIDNFRIVMGTSEFNYPEYYFSNPGGIAVGDEYVYIADTGNNRIVKMKKDFSEWYAIDGFDEPFDIDYSDGQIYIIDKKENDSLGLAGRVARFTDIDFEKLFNQVGSLQSINISGIVGDEKKGKFPGLFENFIYESYFLPENEVFNHNFKDWDHGSYGDLVGTWRTWSDGRYAMFTRFNSSETKMTLNPNPTEGVFCDSDKDYPVSLLNISKYLSKKQYAGRKMTVLMEVKTENDSPEEVYVQLTKHPNVSKVDEDTTHEGLNLTKKFNLKQSGGAGDEGWSLKKVTFDIPTDFDILNEQSKYYGEYATFNDVFLAFNSCEDIEMRYIKVYLEPVIEPTSIAVADNGGVYIGDSSNLLVFKIANFSGGGSTTYGGKDYFKHPASIVARDGEVYILDGISNNNLSIYNEGNNGEMNAGYGAKIDLYGGDVERDLATRIYGGLESNLFTESLMGYSNLYNYENKPRPEAGTTDRVWVLDKIGPAISHCLPKSYIANKEYENQNVDFRRGGTVGGHTFLRRDDCDLWCGSVAGQDSEGNGCNPGIYGLGPVVECRNTEIASSTRCVDQWDWYETWPDCSYWLPNVQKEQNLCAKPTCCRDDGLDPGTVVNLAPEYQRTIEDNWGNSVDFYACRSNTHRCGCDMVKYCYTGCAEEKQDCFGGYAVRHRPDYKRLDISLGSGKVEADTDIQFTMMLHYNQSPTPKNMEIFLKGIEDYKGFAPYKPCDYYGEDSDDPACLYCKNCPKNGKKICKDDEIEECNFYMLNKSYVIDYGQNTVENKGLKTHNLQSLMMDSGRMRDNDSLFDFEKWVKENIDDEQNYYIHKMELSTCLDDQMYCADDLYLEFN